MVNFKVSRHAAAREMVTVAESSLKTSKNCRADEKIAWAEMLNSATEKVNLTAFVFEGVVRCAR